MSRRTGSRWAQALPRTAYRLHLVCRDTGCRGADAYSWLPPVTMAPAWPTFLPLWVLLGLCGRPCRAQDHGRRAV